MMKILLSGSGSGGHIYPCISFIKYLNYINQEYTLLIFKEIDKKIYDLNNINYIFIEKDKIKKVKEQVLKNDIIATFGGKNSLYLITLGKLYKKNIYIFEQNVILGKANYIGSFFAKAIFSSFPLKNKTKKELNYGSPQIDNIKNINKINIFNNDKKVILITMGSLGSKTTMSVMEKYILGNNEYNFIVVYGNNVKPNIKERTNVKIYQYYNHLIELINYASLIISRAGATTLAEIISLNKNAIIIPSPYVANNHQEKNAYSLKECFDIIDENKLAEQIISQNIKKYDSLEYAKRKINNMKKYQYKNICQNIYKCIYEDYKKL